MCVGLTESVIEDAALVRLFEQWLVGGGAGNIRSIGRLRAEVRKHLATELAEIDELVRKLLG